MILQSSLFESMINDEHEKLDFDLVVDEEIFLKLFHLVDGMYPSITHFLSSMSDHYTRMEEQFTGRPTRTEEGC